MPIKVDREERPDLDAVYMQAVLALTGHGGWPMTVFLTPDGEPFYGGTYFPPEPAAACPRSAACSRASPRPTASAASDVAAAGRAAHRALQAGGSARRRRDCALARRPR